MTNISSIFFISQTFFLALTEDTNFIWKLSDVIIDNWDIYVKVYLAVSRQDPAQPFHLVLVLAFVLGNFLVSHICTWHHFLGVWLHSNYTIGHQNSERVLCLILPSHSVESVSSASILHCQSYLQECISRRGLLHYSERSVFDLRLR
jgi:hypothetical protein